jgi:TM2 domain-containing membrane protein YozV
MKACPYCAEQIQDAAIVCKHCGRDLATGKSERIVVVNEAPAWSRGVAAVLSLVIPGAGQMYKGQVLNGIVWLVFVFFGYAALIFPGVILHFFCIIGAASGDPRRK